MMFTCHEQSSYSRLHAISIILIIRSELWLIFLLFTYSVAQHNLWIQKEQVCLLAAVFIYLRVMHNDFVWLYSTLFQRHRNVMETN